MPGNSLRIAIIGSGPSGFYAAEALLKNADRPVRIDIFDRLPAPYGLVRSGVAPDHQKIKRVERSFRKIAQHPSVRFVGNVAVDRDVTVEELKASYAAVIYAVGNEGFRRIDRPGDEMRQLRSATEFVFWYNGHPHFSDRTFPLDEVRRVAVVGVGNVAIDVARVLARSADELHKTDIATYALDALRDCPIEEVLVMGRRGPAQAAYTHKELKEMANLPGAELIIEEEDAYLDPVSAAWLETADMNARKNMELATALAAAPRRNTPRRIKLMFRVSALEFIARDGRLAQMKLTRNTLVDAPGRPRPVPTGEPWLEDVQLVLTAIGYRGIPIPGVPFDERNGIIPNDAGRVTDTPGGSHRRGEYVVGWAKRGPTGLIGSNRPDARETVAALLEDLAAAPPSPSEDLLPQLAQRGVRVVRFADWERLDAEELRRGAAQGRVREKFTSVADMLSFLDG